jgi:hypothetical protein
MDEENSRSGIFVDADGKTEYWWNGFNYGCVLPEKLIDDDLSTSKTKNEKEIE